MGWALAGDGVLGEGAVQGHGDAVHALEERGGAVVLVEDVDDHHGGGRQGPPRRSGVVGYGDFEHELGLLLPVQLAFGGPNFPYNWEKKNLNEKIIKLDFLK